MNPTENPVQRRMESIPEAKQVHSTSSEIIKEKVTPTENISRGKMIKTGSIRLYDDKYSRFPKQNQFKIAIPETKPVPINSPEKDSSTSPLSSSTPLSPRSSSASSPLSPRFRNSLSSSGNHNFHITTFSNFRASQEKEIDGEDSSSLNHLLARNRAWAARVTEKNPDFFKSLINQQTPEILWIGCSDSRVPANEIVDLLPGEVFVHRNIANVVVHTDLNCLSVVQYAVEVLKVKHIIVCGHYGCGGVKAALSNKQYGLIDNWLRHIKDVCRDNRTELDNQISEQSKWDLLTELNVKNSVHVVCETTIIQNAWKNGQPLAVHGWCYRLTDGCVRDLGVVINSPEGIDEIYRC